MDMQFTTLLSNGETVPVCDNGESKKVKFDDIDAYHEMVLQARAREGARQMEAIRGGFYKVVPNISLSLFTILEIERKVCGSSTIEVKDLKQITSYDS